MKPFLILSHNTFWFQGAPFPSDNPPEPDPNVLRRLCAIYRQVSPNVICLQEIQSQAAFAMVRDCLGMSGCYCPGTTLPQYGGAVFWRTGCGKPAQDCRQAAHGNQRMWQVVEASAGGRRLLICNIHLPSHRQIGRAQAAAQRVAELQNLLRGCATQPEVIAGDFNEQPGGPAGAYLESQAYADAAVLAERAHLPTNTAAGRGDYLWLKRQDAGGLLAYNVVRQEDLAWDQPGKQYLSDHLPLWITLKNL